MTENKTTNEPMKKADAKDTPEFDVAEQWPLLRVSRTFKERAVGALVANHTLIVGQSRSGKTNAARRIVEEILTWTDARVVILDPNADFRVLSELDPSMAENTEFAGRWSALGKRLEVARPDGPSWGIKWSELSQEEMAAFLRLTPTDDFAEYRHFDRHLKYERETNGLSTLDSFKNSKYFQVAVGEDLERSDCDLSKFPSSMSGTRATAGKISIHCSKHRAKPSLWIFQRTTSKCE